MHCFDAALPKGIGSTMSEKPKKDEKKAEGDAEKKKGGGIMGLLTKLPVLLGGVMAIEAVILFGAFKMMGSSPSAAEGAALHAAEGEHGEEGDEADEGGEAATSGSHGEGSAPAAKNSRRKYSMGILEFRAPNKVSGKMYLYDVAIEAQVMGKNFDSVQKKVEERKALISDRVRTIIAQSDPEKLNGQAEPGLETLKRQVKYQLDEIVGEGAIEEVLIPRCIPFRADF
jgi:flagellar basal body-associated protein FliL